MERLAARLPAIPTLALLTLFSASVAGAQTTGNWTRQFPQNYPIPRFDFAMAYDSVHRQVVLFGGAYDGYTGIDDTWVWDGSDWTQKDTPIRPPARYGHAMVYDSARGQVVLFGGIIGSGYINDTWVWDGSIWTQKFPQTSPSARAYYGMAYDSKRGEAVLFGGQLQNIYDVDETWVWDGSNWSQKSPQTSPSARSEAALAYDSTRGQMVLFGGRDQVAYNAADTWVWDGSNWSQEFPQPSPNGRSGHSLAYDPVHDQVILFGGAADSETWAWNGGAAPTAGPSITAAVSASAFGGFPTVAPGSWIEIYGSNLAPTTRAWNGTDFTGNNAPTSLEGVQVNIGGQKAFIEYISTNPAQINAQLPSNIPIGGTLQLTVTNPNGASPPFDIEVNQNQPGLLAPALFQISGKQYVVALLPDGTYALPPGSIASVASRQAKPGETIVLFGIGFGSVTPDIPAGQIVTESNQLTQPFELWFGNTPAQLSYYGLAPAAVGLYQFNAVVPPVQDSDAVPLTFMLDGVPGTQNLSIAVHR